MYLKVKEGQSVTLYRGATPHQLKEGDIVERPDGTLSHKDSGIWEVVKTLPKDKKPRFRALTEAQRAEENKKAAAEAARNV